jgi:hypothetical protein
MQGVHHILEAECAHELRVTHAQVLLTASIDARLQLDTQGATEDIATGVVTQNLRGLTPAPQGLTRARP